MRGSVPDDQLLFDPEIDRTVRRLNSKTRRRRQLAKLRREQGEASNSNPQIMAGQNPPPPPASTPCVNSPRHTAQFARNQGRQAEMKTGILSLMYQNPFQGKDHEDPFAHLTKFYEIAGAAGVDEEQELSLFKRLFPHSLIGKAKEWYLDQPTEVMTDWNVLEEKFLERFFSHQRFMDAKTSISVFAQATNESLNEAWERFKSMIRKCKGHGFDELTLVHIFRNGLQSVHKTLLDATAGGSLLSRSAEEAVSIINKMALNDLQGQHNRSATQRTPGILELGTSDAILAQNKLLSQQVELLTQQMSKLPQKLKEMNDVESKNVQVLCCELCKGDHPTGYCPPVLEEEANYANQNQQGYQPRPPYQQPYQNQGYPQRGTYQNQQGWRPDGGYGNRQNPYQSNTQPPPPQSGNATTMEETLTQFMTMSMANQRTNEAAIKNLENQVGQLAKQLAEQKPGPSFSANTQQNPKDCKAVVTRSGGGRGENVVENNGENGVENEIVEEEKIDDKVVEKNKFFLRE